MEFLWIASNLLFNVGVTLGVGASTFALTFYVAALRDGVMDDSEKRFMHIVYAMLRIGMSLIAVTLIVAYFLGFPQTPAYLMQWTLLIVITVNAILMTVHLMPMRFGPILAGGSWYGLFLVSEVPFYGTSYGELLAGYAIFLVLFYIVFAIIKKIFLPSV